jgi:RNA polymerase sigma-70 factor (ECF subfamily)
VSRDDEAANAKLLPLRRVAGKAMELTDAALLAGCAVYDPATLGALYDRYSQAVYQFISRLAGTGEAEIDDLVSATFLEACRSAGNFRGDSSVSTWLYGIGINVVRHHIRSAVRRRALADAYRREPRALPDQRPDDTAESRELLRRLKEAVGVLPLALKEAFVLCEMEGVPGTEAAHMLGVRPGTLWRRLHEARKALRSALS